MALIDAFKKRYTANVWCNNCNTHQEVQIPRGVTLTQFVESGTGKCGNCGCNTLVVDYQQIEEFKEKKPQPKIQILRPRIIPRPPTEPRERAPVPEPRPSTRPKRYKPLPKQQSAPPAFEPRKIFKEDPVDFWTGKERQERPRRQEPNEQPQDQGEEYYTDENY